MAFKVLLDANIHKLDFVISRDQHFQKNSLPSLPVLSPQEFIALIQKESL